MCDEDTGNLVRSCSAYGLTESTTRHTKRIVLYRLDIRSLWMVRDRERNLYMGRDPLGPLVENDKLAGVSSSFLPFRKRIDR